MKPRLALGYVALGAVHIKLRDYSCALIDTDRAIELDPTHAEAFGNRGLLRLLSGQEEMAQQDFAQCLKMDPSLKDKLDDYVASANNLKGNTKTSDTTIATIH